MMKTTTKQLWRLAKLPFAVSLATALAAPAAAITFDMGEIEGSFDSSLSVGASWSTAKRDKRFIGNANGGTGYTQTGDDGRLNFKRGDTFSKIFKGLHDLELRYQDTGVFVRGKYWYDFKLHDQNLRHPDPQKRSISNKGRKEGAKTRGAEVLDAFVFHNYMIGDQPGTVRLGKQVVSWGESTFIMNSINSINPIDVSAFRRPGAELKEGLIPVNMFYVSQSITDRLSAEAFYQLSWKQTVVDNCGTFFSSADVAADGCNDNYYILDSEYTKLLSDNLPTVKGLLATMGPAGAPILNAVNGIEYGPEGMKIRRGKDNKAKDDGQWGMALRWMGDNTEYGAYFMNYHSRTPFLSMQNADAQTQGAINQLIGAVGTFPVALRPLVPTLGLATAVANARYYMDYPEDIRLYGLSFSTTLPTGTAWQGEVSYRPNAPVQINTQQMTLALGSIVNPNAPGWQNRNPSAIQKGYKRKEITQLQTTFTHFFDQVLGAERATLVGEIGYVHVGGLESKRNAQSIRYGRDPIYGVIGSAVDPTGSSVDRYGDHGFVTKNSWGYRLRGVLDYNNAFAGVNLHPSVAFSHDVDGYGPNGLFNEGAKAASFGLDGVYQNTYTAGLSYTNFFDGRYNTMKDRDFVSLTFGMNF
ncbi:DUF1302 domain-containing protein [Thiopseudomonas acetoxidans]|uniref:DUF1302 domain-containing protein n=1 Tax=Thiopseudomonas acetoxidans TaxID=3041622 RepID=A0ABT7SSJ6_9GAMM|nr:DUF1302 domain-containing protein [Thiopseudomonas sp. CY1220]MDM7858542.1 DUF1302 domain-containing protein [Thiopseudomonas sp. CY1220]